MAENEGIMLESVQKRWDVPMGILATLIATFTVLLVLFASSFWLYGQWVYAVVATFVSIIGLISIFKVLKIKVS